MNDMLFVEENRHEMVEIHHFKLSADLKRIPPTRHPIVFVIRNLSSLSSINIRRERKIPASECIQTHDLWITRRVLNCSAAIDAQRNS